MVFVPHSAFFFQLARLALSVLPLQQNFHCRGSFCRQFTPNKVTAKTATDAEIRIVSREKNRKEPNMFRKLWSLALAGLLLHTASIQPAFAQSKAGAQAQLVEKVKAQILHLGVGETSRVMVKLRNNAKMEGYISKAGEESFEVTNKKTGAATAIAYDDVTQVKRKGLSTGAKVGIGIAIGAAVTVTALYIAFKKNGLGHGPLIP